MSYAQSLFRFTDTIWANEVVRINNSTQRFLEIAVPPGGTQAQWDQINKAISEAARMGITIIPTIIQGR